jgi:hypothetical protein
MIDFDVETGQGAYDTYGDQEDLFAKPGYFDQFMDFIESPVLGFLVKSWAKGLVVALVLTSLTFTARFFMRYMNPFDDQEAIN